MTGYPAWDTTDGEWPRCEFCGHEIVDGLCGCGDHEPEETL